jgi:hypothetical protein
MAKETVVIYAEISEWATNGWTYRIAPMEDWQYLGADGTMKRRMIVELEVDKPSKEWIAEAGIEFVANEIQQAKDELIRRTQKMKEFEAKFLLLDMD